MYLPICLGYGRFKFSIIFTNSASVLVKRGLKVFSSNTVVTIIPLKTHSDKNELLTHIFLTCNHELDTIGNYRVTRKFSREQICRVSLGCLPENQCDHNLESTKYLQ